jgi:hypothetical protein
MEIEMCQLTYTGKLIRRTADVSIEMIKARKA